MGKIEKRLWEAADQLWANSPLKPSEHSVPVLGLIFLRYADAKFAKIEQEIASKGSGRRKPGKTDFQARGAIYLPDAARFSGVAKLSEGDDIAEALNEAMRLIEQENEDLSGVLPKTYKRLDNLLLPQLIGKVRVSTLQPVEAMA